MQVRNIILGVAGFGVLLGLVLLALQVRGDAETRVDDSELARALAQHRRAEAASTRSAPAIPGPRTPRVRRTHRSAGRSAPDQDEEREADPGHTTAPPPRQAPHVTIVGDAVSDDTKELMGTATRYYDRGDYPSAEETALEVLKEQPRHIKMLRIVVSASCIMGKPDQAKTYYARLPDRDKRDMRKRCGYYGVKLDE